MLTQRARWQGNESPLGINPADSPGSERRWSVLCPRASAAIAASAWGHGGDREHPGWPQGSQWCSGLAEGWRGHGVGVEGFSTGGRGSGSRISCRATVLQPGMKAASAGGVLLPVPSPLPATAGAPLCSSRVKMVCFNYWSKGKFQCRQTL